MLDNGKEFMSFLANMIHSFAILRGGSPDSGAQCQQEKRYPRLSSSRGGAILCRPPQFWRAKGPRSKGLQKPSVKKGKVVGNTTLGGTEETDGGNKRILPLKAVPQRPSNLLRKRSIVENEPVLGSPPIHEISSSNCSTLFVMCRVLPEAT